MPWHFSNCIFWSRKTIKHIKIDSAVWRCSSVNIKEVKINWHTIWTNQADLRRLCGEIKEEIIINPKL